jgi:hypothetical protein
LAELAIPMSGRAISSSVIPIALRSALEGALATPVFKISLLNGSSVRHLKLEVIY